MIYTINIENLRLKAIIGILPFERENPQEIEVNFSCKYEKNKEFLDYSKIKEFIEESFKNDFLLLEDALEFFYNEIPKRFIIIDSFSLKITKLDIFKNCKVSMEVSYKKDINE
ncbi:MULTISPECIES: dihydroneopterin aldolase [Helicobacter]|uniref:Dihydroneopterin aldolase n=1 Tax=Helicobacter ibis TaxID=2962633 RepID=A0ABT4VEY5_9HELI|nr:MULTISPECIES: dihydroneopterin aldolase [Helicobacter]MDA3967133.1 dihydroneopterin aldolase [Helicobacter sp. WB40]MDA3969261.1 dihydroneopterin aldolase [Helicobacter ibis]